MYCLGKIVGSKDFVYDEVRKNEICYKARDVVVMKNVSNIMNVEGVLK